eukprot:Filipodium_phascolosomae@DN1444_c0_g1_i2.p1
MHKQKSRVERQKFLAECERLGIEPKANKRKKINGTKDSDFLEKDSSSPYCGGSSEQLTVPPRSAFELFREAQWQSVVSEHSKNGVSHKSVTKIIRGKWKELSETEKKHWKSQERLERPKESAKRSIFFKYMNNNRTVIDKLLTKRFSGSQAAVEALQSFCCEWWKEIDNRWIDGNQSKMLKKVIKWYKHHCLTRGDDSGTNLAKDSKSHRIAKEEDFCGPSSENLTSRVCLVLRAFSTFHDDSKVDEVTANRCLDVWRKMQNNERVQSAFDDVVQFELRIKEALDLKEILSKILVKPRLQENQSTEALLLFYWPHIRAKVKWQNYRLLP